MVAILIPDKIDFKTKAKKKDLAIPLQGIFSKKLKTNLKRHIHPYVHCSIIYNNQDGEAT